MFVFSDGAMRWVFVSDHWYSEMQIIQQLKAHSVLLRPPPPDRILTSYAIHLFASLTSTENKLLYDPQRMPVVIFHVLHKRNTPVSRVNHDDDEFYRHSNDTTRSRHQY